MGEGRDETDASPSHDELEGSDRSCEHCGGPIETSEWYPITSVRDDDGSLQFYAFCSEDCQSDWREQRGE